MVKESSVYFRSIRRALPKWKWKRKAARAGPSSTICAPAKARKRLRCGSSVSSSRASGIGILPMNFLNHRLEADATGETFKLSRLSSRSQARDLTHNGEITQSSLHRRRPLARSLTPKTFGVRDDTPK